MVQILSFHTYSAINFVLIDPHILKLQCTKTQLTLSFLLIDLEKKKSIVTMKPVIFSNLFYEQVI